MKSRYSVKFIFIYPLFVACLVVQQGDCAEGNDHLFPEQAAVFSGKSKLEDCLRIQKVLKLDDDRDAVVEIVRSRGDSDFTGISDWLISLNREVEDANVRQVERRYHYFLELRLSSKDGSGDPRSTKIEVEKEIAEPFEKSFRQAIVNAHIPESGKTFLGASQWLRCHSDQEGYHSAVMPAFVTPGGNLAVMVRLIDLVETWLSSGGKDQEMKKRIRESLEKLSAKEFK